MKIRKLELKKKKAQSIIAILVWLVMSFTIVMFFALWVYGFDKITTTLIGIETHNPSVNISKAAADSFGQINPMQKTGLHVLAFVMILVSGISILITNFLVKTHPAFFLVYLFVIIGAIIASVYISNQYEKLMQDNVIGETLSEFTGASFIMLSLHIWTSVIGIFGAIFLFAGILRDRESGGSIV